MHVMLKFSIAMVTVERFFSLKSDKNFGYGKKTICRILIISWLLAFVSQLVSWLIRHFRTGRLLIQVELTPGFITCSLTSRFFLYEFADYMCILFSICCMVSVGIGTIYIIHTQKPSSTRIKKSMVAPLAYGLFFLCYVVMELFKETESKFILFKKWYNKVKISFSWHSTPCTTILGNFRQIQTKEERHRSLIHSKKKKTVPFGSQLVTNRDSGQYLEK